MARCAEGWFAMSSAKKPTLTNLGLLALEYARAVNETAHCRQVLQGGYLAWRKDTGNESTNIQRNSPEWNAMMQATAGEYREQEKAKRIERNAKAKLLALARKLEG